jgi:hypothetical protein
LGIIEGFEPTHLQHAITALSAQLELDESATELKFDDGGKLSFAKDQAEREATIAAPRLSSALRQRRYGEHHVDARRSQVQGLANDVAAYLQKLDARISDFSHVRAGHLWLDEHMAAQIEKALTQARAKVGECEAQLIQLRERIDALPRQDSEHAAR